MRLGRLRHRLRPEPPRPPHRRRRHLLQHGEGRPCAAQGSGYPRVVLVGSPNVGKSALFHRLTGMYVVVSNYPGTTVEISRGYAQWTDQCIEIVDTPGMYSLRVSSEEERVAREILIQEHSDLVVHVVDTRNIARMLCLTLELIEAGLPVLLVANMQDEAEKSGIALDLELVSGRLGIDVVGTSAASGAGVEALQHAIEGAVTRCGPV